MRGQQKYGFKMVAVNSAPVALCKEYLKGSGVHVGAAVSFPLGQTTIECKVFETKDAIANGADEIDYVINVAELKNKNYKYIKEEMKRIVSVCRGSPGVISKVIFENCYLTKEEIQKAAQIAKEVKPDFIKNFHRVWHRRRCCGGCEADESRGRRRCESKGGRRHPRLENLQSDD